jgi:hypothetical protein
LDERHRSPLDPFRAGVAAMTDEEPEAITVETRGGAAPAVIHLPDDRQCEKKVTRGSENRQRTDAFLVRVHRVLLRSSAASANTLSERTA